MRFRDRQFSERDMALYAREASVLFSRIDLKIQDSAVVRGFRDMTHIARNDRNFFGQRIERIHRSGVMTARAFEVGVARKFVSERRGRISFSPRRPRNFVQIADRCGKFCIEIRLCSRRSELMASGAICRRRENSGVGRMAGKTRRMACRHGFEGSLFQPETIAQIRGRLDHEFVVGFPLRLKSLVTNRAAFFACTLSRKGNIHHPAVTNFVLRNYFNVFVVRKRDRKIGNVPFSLRRQIESFARIRKRMSRAVSGNGIRVADRADHRLCRFEKLLAMTIQT